MSEQGDARHIAYFEPASKKDQPFRANSGTERGTRQSPQSLGSREHPPHPSPTDLAHPSPTDPALQWVPFTDARTLPFRPACYIKVSHAIMTDRYSDAQI
jgi:hypothetical protein